MDRYRTARDRVDDEDAGFVDPGVAEGRTQELAGPPHERAAQGDLLLSRRLADENERRVCVSSAPDGGTNPAVGAGFAVLCPSVRLNGRFAIHHVGMIPLTAQSLRARRVP